MDPRRWTAALAVTFVLMGCTPASQSREPRPPEPTRPTVPVDPRTPMAEAFGNQPVADDPRTPPAPALRRLAERLVAYAAGDTDAFPHARTISLRIGGRPVGTIEAAGAIADRTVWARCPADDAGYAARACPIDLLAVLGRIGSSEVRRAGLVASAEPGEVTCAPEREGPLPPGRRVVLRPAHQWRTCVSDFALVLVADDRDRLSAVDLTLAEP